MMFTRFSQDVHPTGTQPLRESAKNGSTYECGGKNE
jgi:hypothetical protein